MKIDELQTPCLIVDLDKLESNISKMASYCKSVGCSVRPHAKAHKNPLIARKQLAGGAVGLCCQTLEEAESLVYSGIEDVLITNIFASKNAFERILNLARNGRIILTVDSAEVAKLLSKAAKDRNCTLEVLVEINVGQNRTGVQAGPEAAKLAKLVSSLECLRFRGLMGYEGHLQLSMPEFDKRKSAVKSALSCLTQSIEETKREGIDVEIVTSGGTGTYNITAEYEGVTDIQPGSYVMMDNRYNLIDTAGKDFQNSLFLISTVVSKPDDSQAVVDLGWKSASVEYSIYGWNGMPRAVEYDASYSPGGDEHGILKFQRGAGLPSVGDRMKFIPSHCDTTLNLHNKFYGVRNGRVEVVCPIARR
ncbi:MAG TPA: DSD1 family PLP-dependent enzyme [Nitrososphaerales archaeon]|nr:DSD1 family PLP-dependent enzyme [Nitrososphaerales archaeon]